jgi:hypothetical protein
MKKTLTVKNVGISLLSKKKQDYISLTDMAKFKNKDSTGLVISHWISTRYAIDLMGLWEQIHNPDFNVTEFRNIRNESGTNGFVLSGKRWIGRTGAIGLISKPGRYGGTFAHKDIAFEFASWISVEFKLYLIKEFQRLKEEEEERHNLDWNAKRMLTKINYRIHTDAIKEHLIPNLLTKKQTSLVYASEADILNMALFGVTAKQWANSNSRKKGNVRDHANIIQLVCLANLESLNAEFIRQKISPQERLVELNQIAIIQMRSLSENMSTKKLPE